MTRSTRWFALLAFWRWRVIAEVDDADEIPARIATKGVVRVGTRISPKWIAFDCPCNRGHRILLNVDARRKPRWTVRSETPFDLSPSVDAVFEGIRCHYFVRRGEVEWVPRWLEEGPTEEPSAKSEHDID